MKSNPAQFLPRDILEITTSLGRAKPLPRRGFEPTALLSVEIGARPRLAKVTPFVLPYVYYKELMTHIASFSN